MALSGGIRRWWPRALACLATLFFLVPHSAVASEPTVLVVIVGDKSPIDNVSINELRKIFLKQRQSWSTGTKVMPLNAKKDSPERALFEKLVLGMSPEQSQRYWVDQKLRGRGTAPKEVASVVLLQRVVAKLGGAVGYVRADQFTGKAKALKVDGKDHTHPRYPLRGP